ncbi:MAG: amino acid adenylation domain-containing protein [Acidobacteriota bacterium]
MPSNPAVASLFTGFVPALRGSEGELALPAPTLLHAFCDHAKRAPQRAAVEWESGTTGTEQVTYGELSRWAARYGEAIAAAMADSSSPSPSQELVVALCLPRGAELVAAMLGTLAAGGAYVALDPDHPPQRNRTVLEDSGAAVLVADSATAAALESGVPQSGARLVTPQQVRDAEVTTELPLASWPTAPSATDSLAYLVYTSGSTGRPKGVALGHRGLLRLAGASHWFRVEPGDRVGQIIASTFDVSMLEIWAALINGATLVVVAPEVVREPPRFAAALRRLNLDVMVTPTALVNEVVRQDPGAYGGLRGVFAGGEAAEPAVFSRMLEQGSPETLFNAYGPTESSAISLWQPLPRERGAELSAALKDAGSVPIGEPVEGSEAWLLDSRGLPVAEGDGELALAGEGLARGYWGLPARTADAFRPHPAAQRPGARVYRTGDKALRREDGAFEFLGRLDRQVKIRGHRIELGEVEAKLREHPALAQVAVDTRGEGPAKRLVAWVILDSAAATASPSMPATAQLRAFLAPRLPEAMTPTAFVAVDEFPLTAHGKVDHSALPEPAPREAVGRLPEGDVERTIAGLWQQGLGLSGEGLSGESLGAEESLFSLGGNSLLTTRLASAVAQHYQVPLDMGTLFVQPTVEVWAQEVERAVAAAAADSESGSAATDDSSLPPEPPLVRVEPRPQDAPPSLAQQRTWFLQKLDPSSLAYQAQAVMHLRGRLDFPALEAALSAIVARHETMHSIYPSVEGRPVQRILEPFQVRVPVVDFSALPEEGRQEQVREALEAIYKRNLPMDRLPLVHWVAARLGPDHHDLLHFEHHLVHDGWSYNVFLRELSTLYGPSLNSPQERSVAALSRHLEPMKIQVADLALWQLEWVESVAAERQLDYWRGKLLPLPPSVELPADHPRPKVQSFRGHTLKSWLPVPLSREVRTFGQQRDATVFMVLFAAYVLMLRRLTGLDDITVGSGVANRSRQEIEGLIGMVLNTVVLRVSTAQEEQAEPLSFAGLVDRVRQVSTEAWAHQDLPWDKLVDELQPERSASHNPFFQTLFSFHDAPMQALHLEGLEVDLEVALPNGSAKLDLNTTVVLPREQRMGHGDGDERILFQWELNRDLLEPATVEGWVRGYEHLVGEALENPDIPLSELSLLDAGTRRQLVAAGRREDDETLLAVAQESRLGDFLAAAVSAYPGRPALAFGDPRQGGESCTYQELGQAVNRLAARLRAAGIGPDSRVGVCMDRSLELPAALGAVLAAGAAYVPLDPTYPAARLEYLLQDAGVDRVLVDGASADRVASLSAVVEGRVVVDHLPALRAWSQLASPTTGPEPEAAGAAYVIHTSGSTGQPKGAMIPHRAIANRLLWMARFLDLDAGDVLLQKTPTSFDVSVWELFLAPLAGARLALAAPGAHRDPAALLREIEAHGVTVIHFVPSMLREFLHAPELDLRARSLRHVVASGEALESDLVATFRQRLPWAELHNLYGPTEAAVDVTAWTCTEKDGEAVTVPIGHPVSNVDLWVVDADDQLTLPGAPGELLLGGVQLARGYLGKPRRTALAFVPDPHSGRSGARLYRTGDRVRSMPSGELLFLGRIDHQVKIRGFRIEVGEIEAALLAHPTVAAAAVIPSPSGDALVAHWVASSEATEGAEEDLHQELHRVLGELLPEHLVPERFLRLEQLPSTPSGKVDRKALGAALESDGGGEGMRERVYEAPATEVEELLAEVWTELIGVEQVGRDDHFFRLGGHSLHATRLIYRLRELLEVDLPVRAVYQTPTLRAMAQRVEQALLEDLMDEEAVGSAESVVDDSRWTEPR